MLYVNCVEASTNISEINFLNTLQFTYIFQASLKNYPYTRDISFIINFVGKDKRNACV